MNSLLEWYRNGGPVMNAILLVAVIGAVLVTIVSVAERWHEHAVLRALGLERPGLRKLDLEAQAEIVAAASAQEKALIPYRHPTAEYKERVRRASAGGCHTSPPPCPGTPAAGSRAAPRCAHAGTRPRPTAYRPAVPCQRTTGPLASER